MADVQLFTNNAVSLLAAPITAGATSLTVMAGYGALFPQPAAPNEYFLVTLENQTGTAREIVRVNGRTGDTLTGLVRGQEGTVAQAWSATLGNDTLVDHRVTAETMRLAMILPELVAARDPSVAVPATTTNSVAEVTYSDTQRMAKFWVQMYEPATGLSQAFEVYTIIQGVLATNSETATYTKNTRIGFNFPGDVNISLNTTTKTMSLQWINNDPTKNVVVTVTRI